MENDWVKFYAVSNPVEAEIIVDMLRENEIDAVVMNKRDSSLSFGAVEIYCRKNDVEAALKLINENRNEK